jgi:hypothetical protein
MNPLVFYNRVVKHEIYGCCCNRLKNFYGVFRFLRFNATFVCDPQNLSNLVVLLAVLQLIFQKRPSFKILLDHDLGNSSKKVFVFFELSKFSNLLQLKENLFNFLVFKQQRVPHVCFGNKVSFFFNVHPLAFGVFSQYYRFVFSLPRLRFSYHVNPPFIFFKPLVFARFLRLPL